MTMTDLEAEQRLKELAEHFGEPVMPVSRYCQALQTWVDCVQTRAAEDDDNQFKEYADHLGTILIHIDKSSLLWRLIYAGQQLRTEKCPKHQGHWSGCFVDCEHGCGGVGWLPAEGDDPGPTPLQLVTIAGPVKD